MKAKVWLVGSHHNFHNGPVSGELVDRLEAKERGWDMLVPEHLRRRVAGYSGNLMSKEWNVVYVSALKALTRLDGFVSLVSFRVVYDGEKDRIHLAKRDWGRIYLASTNQCVLRFSHDTRFANKAFTGLLEWPEDPLLDGDNEITKVMLAKYSNVDIWHELFLRRIEENLSRYQKQAEDLIAEANHIVTQVDDMRSALQKLTAP